MTAAPTSRFLVPRPASHCHLPAIQALTRAVAVAGVEA
jgi:hypothetical protein